MSTSIQKIRPAARLIRTIGQDLIKDVYAAIVELVKNAYDADSPSVHINFIYKEEQNRLLIQVQDQGHGMDSNTVINQWLVPATDDKLQRKISSKGRILQGRKGIGRFAASVLGERILLETVREGEITSLILDMEELENLEYLDQLDLNITIDKTTAKNGTTIEVEKDNVQAEDVKNLWTPKQIHKLLVELRSLISPEDVFQAASDNGYEISFSEFKIELTFQDFPIEEYSNRKIEIAPFPVLDLFDYRISGTVDAMGNANLNFENQNIPSLTNENFSTKMNFTNTSGISLPGEVFIDLRVYDRDPESISNMIKRGLKDPDTNEYVGKSEARRILDEYYGVGIYREQFRIRPYGEQSFDWLELDKYRVQDPSRKIGHNQVIGFVYIRQEESSGLTEKSARDGLTENEGYYGLKHIVQRYINELEARRYNYRVKAMKGGRRRSVDDDLGDLFDFDQVTKSISKSIEEIGLKGEERSRVTKVVGDALESEKKKKIQVVNRVKDTLAIYQGQATLGKITHVLLHEGRKNIKYISETMPRLTKWALKLSKAYDEDTLNKLSDRSGKIEAHASALSYLFKKIEPLARTRRSSAKNINIIPVIESTLDIFDSEMKSSGITYELESDSTKLVVNASEIDLFTVFSNLIENSIYWMSSKKEEGLISIHAYSSSGEIIVEYSDNGPGFQGSSLEYMFEPGYSTKPEGTGLGLALAGESMARMKGSIKAVQSEKGALFEVCFKEVNND